MSCLSVVLWLTVVSIVAEAQPATATMAADREQILQLERDWTQSFVTMDVAANQRIVADDYLGTEPDGKRITKADLIAAMKGQEGWASNRLNESDVDHSLLRTDRHCEWQRKLEAQIGRGQRRDSSGPTSS